MRSDSRTTRPSTETNTSQDTMICGGVAAGSAMPPPNMKSASAVAALTSSQARTNWRNVIARAEKAATINIVRSMSPPACGASSSPATSNA